MEGNIHRAQRNVHQRILRLAQKSPRQMVGLKQAGLKATGHRLGRAVNVVNNTQSKRLDAVRAQLEAVGPERVLARGYSVTMQTETGEVVRDVKQLAGGQKILTRLHKGKIYSTVNRTK
jgi:exodeoxyribonuclease VII large subunit